jgi:small GTP-binding protein
MIKEEGIYKVIVVGSYNVGKSSIICRLMNDRFNDEYHVTVGVEYSTKTIDVEGEPVSLQIWDSVEEVVMDRLDRTSTGLWSKCSSWGWSAHLWSMP